MSGKTGLTIKQVNNWLCNQRRKQDGRGNEKDRKRRLIMREEQLRKGISRSSVFSQSQLKLFEQYHFKAELAEIGGSSFKIPYGDLVVQTGQDRKKIRDWFSKRKSKDRKFAETMKNTLVENEVNVPFETNTGPNLETVGYDETSASKFFVNSITNQPPNELHQSLSKILSSFVFPEDRV
ncbi:hypothetical protein L3Y34_012329 [Caenorhabditis briggsae]|nr:hypothetical protein L3Y34_012329 [Caenorhabditis briggsae]